ncbi:neck protein [Prochlorococcus phage P-SSM7]|uniref:Neck protein n=1 Tax=Prochlorococcus phage P-SSM7 TaxID=445688 RepID=E3SNL8_9CAUD|nr:head closure Hc2 [Prochlorococcus phage P-SSM7]ADO99003.1 neck protein [Prochlorococcus phage P-SSM7]
MAFTNTPASDFVFRDHTNLLKANGSAQEQTFIENLIVESIEIYGQDIYYMPRTYVNRDTILGEVENSRFTQALQVRAYVNNVEGWEGQGELLSKFGVRIEDKTTFVFSREKFTSAVDDNAVLNVEGRPNEGDLIWFPATKHLFEIQFVEAERPFYQLGKGFVWECQCELFQYADEALDTGVAEIDGIEAAFANAITVNFAAGGTGTFTVGEVVAGGTSNVTAEVKAWNATDRQLQVYNRSGIFTIPETVTGQTSGAAWTSASYNTLNNVNTADSIDTNFGFETADDDIIDFTEGNPFGSIGSTTDTTI